jgi:nicotinamidase-related amidase
MSVSLANTALVITDPQIDFLSPEGVTWGVVGESVQEHNTVAHIGNLLDAAKKAGMTVVISPHYYYPTDHGWNRQGDSGWDVREPLCPGSLARAIGTGI